MLRASSIVSIKNSYLQNTKINLFPMIGYSMDLGELENVLAGTLSPDQNIRKAAELHLRKVGSYCSMI